MSIHKVKTTTITLIITQKLKFKVYNKKPYILLLTENI